MIVAAKQRDVARAVHRKKIKTYCDTKRHDAANRIAAEVILDDPERYSGALLQWAQAFMARMGK